MELWQYIDQPRANLHERAEWEILNETEKQIEMGKKKKKRKNERDDEGIISLALTAGQPGPGESLRNLAVVN